MHIELHEKKTQYISLGTIIAAILNIILNLIFIPKYGYIAAAYTTMFCYFVLMFVHLFITRRILKVKLYDDWFMFAALFVSALISALLMSLYNTYLLRYGVLLIICAVYFCANRKYIIAYINKRRNKKVSN